MKPETIKSILRSYLSEKQRSACYDAPDGFPRASSGIMAGETFGDYEGRCSDLLFMAPETAHIPLEDLHVPLDADREALLQRVGRRLSEISDHFQADYAEASKNRAAGSKTLQFKQHVIQVPLTCRSIEIPIVRSGTTDGSANVAWRTADKSAIAGFHYVGSNGSISFAEGDTEKAIKIEINQEGFDVCFTVELFNAEGINIGSFNPLTVYIVDDSQLYADERQVIKNIFNSSRNISISNVVSCLQDKVTPNTFKAALQCVCGSADSVPMELALASELVRLTLPYARLATLTNVLCDFCIYLPELEDIVALRE
ncbi:calx-beta domain-containing protein [Caerostris darwini]|uniref:Calx-beta domain-containing protein n=1 Tax=Caerostris darwini TaxID=1538125 RepID=A0AAV4V2K5_9ARAC|nr:calx-beta domain-containing protein [Caerostris darwini]